MLALSSSHLVVGLVSFLIPIVVQWAKNKSGNTPVVPGSPNDPLLNHPVLAEIRDALKALKAHQVPAVPSPAVPSPAPDWAAIVAQLLALLQASMAPVAPKA